MLILEVNLIAETKNSTASIIKANGEHLGFIIEDGYREIKEYGNTRIPPGTYKLQKRIWGGFYKRYNQRFKHEFSIQLLEVPNFSNILIHIGNRPKDTAGCLLINTGVNLDVNTGEWYGQGSIRNYKKLYKLFHVQTSGEIIVNR